MTIDLDRLVDNATPMDVRAFPLRDRQGYENCVVIAKLSWLVAPGGKAVLALPQRPVRSIAERSSGEPFASVRYPEDLAPEKPGTDVIMLGAAHPPADRSARQMQVSLRLESGKRTIKKAVSVFGARLFAKGAAGVVPGPAQPIEPTPLVYELAKGGRDPAVGEARLGEPGSVDEHNPAGRGHARDKRALIGMPAYCLEPADGTEPAGFGPIDASWPTRQRLAGTRDAAWIAGRAPLPPADLDPRCYCAAHPDLWSEEPLLGDEPVEILGATPEPAFLFKLPRHEARFSHEGPNGARALGAYLDTHLDTFLIDLTDPDARVVELVWRASVRMPRRPRDLGAIAVTLDPPLPDDLCRESVLRCIDEGLEGLEAAAPAREGVSP